jgi:hypothetical protein
MSSNGPLQSAPRGGGVDVLVDCTAPDNTTRSAKIQLQRWHLDDDKTELVVLGADSTGKEQLANRVEASDWTTQTVYRGLPGGLNMELFIDTTLTTPDGSPTASSPGAFVIEWSGDCGKPVCPVDYQLVSFPLLCSRGPDASAR